MQTDTISSPISRRDTLKVGATGVALAAIGLTPSLSFADSASLEAELVKRGLDGAKMSDMLTLEMPEIAENGATVPVSVSVDSPMSAEDHVKRIILLADGNPNPFIIEMNFSPASGAAEASTRMRLAKTQNVVAVAETSTGAKFMAQTEVKVTIGGCGG